jgi:hypothetical protein
MKFDDVLNDGHLAERNGTFRVADGKLYRTRQSLSSKV